MYAEPVLPFPDAGDSRYMPCKVKLLDQLQSFAHAVAERSHRSRSRLVCFWEDQRLVDLLRCSGGVRSSLRAFCTPDQY